MGALTLTRTPGTLVVDAGVRGQPHDVEGCALIHSWTADGRRVCWQTSLTPGAVDAESWAQDVPDALAARWPLPRAEFWTAWTRAEVHAKLLDVPILTWLQTHGLSSADTLGVTTWNTRFGDLEVTCGYLWRQTHNGNDSGQAR